MLPSRMMALAALVLLGASASLGCVGNAQDDEVIDESRSSLVTGDAHAGSSTASVPVTASQPGNGGNNYEPDPNPLTGADDPNEPDPNPLRNHPNVMSVVGNDKSPVK